MVLNPSIVFKVKAAAIYQTEELRIIFLLSTTHETLDCAERNFFKNKQKLVAGTSIGFKAKADAGLRPEVPAKPMPIVVNTVQYFEDLDLASNAGIGPKGRACSHF